MKLSRPALFAIAMTASLPVWPQAATPAAEAADPVVLRVGEQALTRSEYEKLVLGFERSAGAPTTGVDKNSVQSGKEVARLLAIVEEAQRRGVDKDPKISAVIRVRTYTLLANALLAVFIDEAKRDEAGTRALWASEKSHYQEAQVRQILVRHAGVAVDGDIKTPKGLARSEVQARAHAQSLHDKLKAGADFAQLARSSSDDEATAAKGGELPPFARGAMVAEFEAVAFDKPVGSVSAPFKTKYGWHIVQIVDRQPFAFERVRATLEFQRARQRVEEIAGKPAQLETAYFKP